MIKDRSKILL